MNAGMVGLTEWQIAKSRTEQRNDYGRSAANDQIESVSGAEPSCFQD
jgi:hypothetical protein